MTFAINMIWDKKLFSRCFFLFLTSVHSRKLQKGASDPLDSKTGSQFQKLGSIDKGPRVSKLEGGHFKKA
jgi:hypothetical protein